MTKPGGKNHIPFPTKEQVVEFIENSSGRISKREIARAFHIRGDDRKILKAMLNELKADGQLVRQTGGQLRGSEDLPNVTVCEIIGPDKYGDLVAKPNQWVEDSPPPRIYFSVPKSKHAKTLGVGAKVLARLKKLKDEDGVYYQAMAIKILDTTPTETIMGVFEGGDNGGRVIPTDRKVKKEFIIDKGNTKGATHGTLVLVDEVQGGKPNRQKRGTAIGIVKECLGDVSAPKAISLIAIHHHGIPINFSEEALKEAIEAKPAPIKDRVDLRDVPFITIDPSDARDHDDAMFAEPDDDHQNPDGWHIMVAIADVAHYVKPDGAIDKDARERGNSCYFPDRVVPMLPEELSTDLCSLKPGVDRAAMVCHMWLDKDGRKRRHKFERALIKSQENIAYEDVQRAMDGDVSPKAAPLLEPILNPLYGAWRALMKARDYRAPLDLDMPEKRIYLDDMGNVAEIRIRERLDAHRVVEEYMVIANVAAAEELEKHNTRCMYRVHEEPGLDKLEHLRNFLKTLEFSLAKGQVMKPEIFNRILHKAKDSKYQDLINTVVLRSQTQAYYSPDNRGHFGLSLPRYAHFTSPIRRYSDLLVHRGLVSALKLGTDGLTDENKENMVEIGEAISSTERRAMVAERDSSDRYLAAYLSDQVGEEFKGRITGVIKFGLFLSLEPTGADGFIPVSTLLDDYYDHDEAHHCLVGKRHGKKFQLGDMLEVRLKEVEKVTGSLRLELLDSLHLPKNLMRKGRNRGAGKGRGKNKQSRRK